MHFDLHLRHSVVHSIRDLAERMKDWESVPALDGVDRDQLLERITFFEHTRQRQQLTLAGVDGSGDYPALSYADSFIYFSVAQAVIYRNDPLSGLREIGPTPETVYHFTWLPETEAARHQALDEAFAALAGRSLPEVISRSDYRRFVGEVTTTELIAGLIRPHAADAGNLAIQLRSTAELGAALRALDRNPDLDYLLIDGTLSLPFAGRGGTSLFHEHLKRLCCVEATHQGIGFLALSKSHGLPGIDVIENLVREKSGVEAVAEHWYLRLPVPGHDDWMLPSATERNLPPPGAVSYLFRLHRTTPTMRLDMDRDYWLNVIKGESEDATRTRERQLFENLDYASHDQRCYGYPYPIKAGHDRASLTKPERVALRKQIIDAAVQAGMKRHLFRDVAQATGHA